MLNRLLEHHHGIRDATMTRLERGHTNESFAVATPSTRYVLRRAWPGKPDDQIAAEEHVLSMITSDLPFDVPRVIATRDGEVHANEGDRAIHLFAQCRGEPGPRYLAASDHARMYEAMSCLAQLHRALDRVPRDDDTDDAKTPEWHWLTERVAGVRAGDLSSLPAATSTVLDRIAALIPTTESHAVQWLHGDFHLGNLLWTDDRITGVVDFDETGRGSPTSEVAMALFALARQPNEARFSYDDDLWATGLAAYGGALPLERAFLMQLFCAYQVLIHLAAAQRGLWTLDGGIGFWPCWNTLSSC